jgi:hypothetical protein
MMIPDDTFDVNRVRMNVGDGRDFLWLFWLQCIRMPDNILAEAFP